MRFASWSVSKTIFYKYINKREINYLNKSMNSRENNPVHNIGVVISFTIAIIILFSFCYLYGFLSSLKLDFKLVPVSFSDIPSTALNIAPILLIITTFYILMALVIIKYINLDKFKITEEPQNKKISLKSFFVPIAFFLIFLFIISMWKTDLNLIVFLKVFWWLLWMSIAHVILWDEYLEYKIGGLILNTFLVIVVGIGYMYLDGYGDGMVVQKNPTKNCVFLDTNNNKIKSKIIYYFNAGLLLKNEDEDYEFIPFGNIKKIYISHDPVYCTSYIPSIK